MGLYFETLNYNFFKNINFNLNFQKREFNLKTTPKL